MDIGEMESWPDEGLTLCVDSASVTAQDRFVAALELWHRGKRRIEELEALNAEQSDQISKQGKRISEQGAWIERLCEPRDLCPVCLTWSWAPCNAEDEGAEQWEEKWVLCQCCNDSRIAVSWKARAGAAEAELDKLREGELK